MPIAAPPPADPEAEPALERFALTVLPESPRHAWQAWLRAEDGSETAFASPIELLRHVARLGLRQGLPPTLK